MDRTDNFENSCGSGLDQIQFLWIRTGLGLKHFTVEMAQASTFAARPEVIKNCSDCSC